MMSEPTPDILDRQRSAILRNLEARQAGISDLTQKANEQEFVICRLLIGWAIAAIGVIVAHLLSVLKDEWAVGALPYVSFFRWGLILLGLSLVSGIVHHLFFMRDLRRAAKGFDERNIAYARKLHEAGPSVFGEILRDMGKEELQPSMAHTTLGFLGAQIVFFGAASITVVIPIFIR